MEGGIFQKEEETLRPLVLGAIIEGGSFNGSVNGEWWRMRAQGIYIQPVKKRIRAGVRDLEDGGGSFLEGGWRMGLGLPRE